MFSSEWGRSESESDENDNKNDGNDDEEKEIVWMTYTLNVIEKNNANNALLWNRHEILEVHINKDLILGIV